MIDKIKRFFFIIFILVTSYLVSGILAKELFLNNTQIIRPHLPSYLAMRFQNLTSPVSTFIAKLQGRGASNGGKDAKTIEERYAGIENVAFSQVATGVAARERDGIAEVKYDLDNIKWIEYTYTTRSGTTIVIKVPEGQKPPPNGVL